ncbi:MAG TPA: sigma-54-dependent Fis family transcriptional regulator [Alicyclobacillus sp.]|nr:sigma-54-dependent Fis family transcriptional regulator [Alicyclobacillus sp.]
MNTPFSDHQLSIVQTGEQVNRWEAWVKDGILDPKLRKPIKSSWERCKSMGIAFSTDAAPIRMKRAEVQHISSFYREMIEVALPIMRYVQREHGSDQAVVTLSDHTGLLLQVTVDNDDLLKHVKHRHFFEGADWSESGAGTNAVGTAVIEKHPVRVIGAEHYCAGWHEWACSAVPIFEPLTGTLLGVLDITSRRQWYETHNLPLIQWAANRIGQDLHKNAISDAFFGLVQELDKPAFLLNRHLYVTWANAQAMAAGIRSGEQLPVVDGPPALLTGQDHGTYVQEFRLGEGDVRTLLKVIPYRLWGLDLGVLCLMMPTSGGKSTAKSSSKSKAMSPVDWTTHYTMDSIIGRTPVILEAKRLAHKAANLSAPVFLAGESGTGKELFAHAIHASGPRRSGPFVTVNCGTLQRELAASELFGYEEGAFTGAKKHGQRGKFLLADKGTIFLDEIAELPIDCQSLLLRVLEEGRVVPVGGTRPIHVDVRVITATHKNLDQEVQSGRFRKDLFYRLSALWIRLPSLRERSEDIPLLVDTFLRQFAKEMGRTSVGLSPEAMQRLTEHSWPGNIRELKNVLQRAVFLCDGNVIEPRHICLAGPFENAPSVDTAKKRTSIHRSLVEQALRESGGNVTEAAQTLGISRATMYRKMKLFNLI